LNEAKKMKLEFNQTSYLTDFARSFQTFKHHVVYDPIGKAQICLNDTDQILDFLGKIQTDCKVAEALSKGEINPELQEHDFSATPKKS
jgi:hypothetical protein